jgi:hypothetical protein
MMARGEHVVRFVIVVDLDPSSVKPPLPWAQKKTQSGMLGLKGGGPNNHHS